MRIRGGRSFAELFKKKIEKDYEVVEIIQEINEKGRISALTLAGLQEEPFKESEMRGGRKEP